MNITGKKIGANQLKIYVEGKINITTVETFRNEVNRISAGFDNVVFDFGGVNYISSVGLREVLICRKKFPDMRIENMSREVFEIFSMTGFQHFIPITQAKDAAPKVDDILNEFVDTEKSSPYVQISFKKFLRDKATYSAEKIFVVSAGEENFSRAPAERICGVVRPPVTISSSSSVKISRFISITTLKIF